MIAVIFTSQNDYKAAVRAAVQLGRCGVEAVVARDVVDFEGGLDMLGEGEVVTTFGRNGRMYGGAAALGMVETMLEVSEKGEKVCRVDADTWVGEEGVRWLEGAGTRGFGFGRMNRWWCGCWSAERETLVKVRGLIKVKSGKCGGCLIAEALRSVGEVLVAPEGTLEVIGRTKREGAWVRTLRTALTRAQREESLRELFSVGG